MSLFPRSNPLRSSRSVLNVINDMQAVKCKLTLNANNQSFLTFFLSILFLLHLNSQERQQPPYFEELDQLYEYLQTAGKKPVHMSQKTLETLQLLKDEYEQNDVHEQDSVGHFVDRQAVKLGLKSSKCIFRRSYIVIKGGYIY